ncbi:RNA polymerase sigma factor [Sneathiella glossodoripedis]|uniref:RNA polymerase sigma factor n=1 Tax=Sneathiella glossodoripedis TaxID=418853 RepID=UPI00046F34C5|nr:sigma-70 family RNA polymerase sigma factor [Sneathiella glossodoripedis]
MTATDTELIRKISEGDEKAFADFYRMFEKRLYHFIKQKLNDPFEAADILNETFLEVWRKAATFEGRSKVSTWLFGIAYFKTVDRMRKNGKLVVGDEEIPEQVDETADAMACLLAKENGAHIQFCLEQLKLAHRTVIELAFLNDMAYGEIAKIVSCPENTVKTRMFHAKQLMKNCLSNRLGGTA